MRLNDQCHLTKGSFTYCSQRNGNLNYQVPDMKCYTVLKTRMGGGYPFDSAMPRCSIYGYERLPTESHRI